MRILIVKLSSIGDVVHTLPAVAHLRRTHPNAWISWVVDVRASAILKGCPAIDDLIEIDFKGLRTGIFDPKTIGEARLRLEQLRGSRDRRLKHASSSDSQSRAGARPDIAIDFQGLVKSGLIALLSGARRRVGFASYDLREEASRHLLTDQVATGWAAHIIDKNLALAESIAQAGGRAGRNNVRRVAERPRYEFPIAVSAEDEAHITHLVSGIPRFAIINPGGGWMTKRWAAARYAEVADWLWTEYETWSIVTYGPAEEELACKVVGGTRSGKCREAALTLKQFVALARRARLFVGGDTGPLHLAAAAGTPVVGLYGPTSPERNGPFDPQDITLGRDLWCRAGCHRRKCWHWECLDIPTEQVKQGIRTRLSETEAVRTSRTLAANEFFV